MLNIVKVRYFRKYVNPNIYYYKNIIMCKHIYKSGWTCALAPYQEFCWRHQPAQGYCATYDSKEVEKRMAHIDEAGRKLERVVQCPCGAKMKRWNYVKHCNTKIHKAWEDAYKK